MGQLFNDHAAIGKIPTSRTSAVMPLWRKKLSANALSSSLIAKVTAASWSLIPFARKSSRYLSALCCCDFRETLLVAEVRLQEQGIPKNRCINERLSTTATSKFSL